MKARITILMLMAVILSVSVEAQKRVEQLLEKGWKFTREDNPEFKSENYDDSEWQQVTIPHDWAIYGPFSIDNDKQNVAITQDGQKEAMEHAGRTGGLPFVGAGWYRLGLNVPDLSESSKYTLVFDGAMSHARVYLNGEEICYWPSGYNSFYVDATPYLKKGTNTLAVRLENLVESSRWYPGAGLYRNVHFIETSDAHVPVWGTYIATPEVNKEFAKVKLCTELTFPAEKSIKNYKIVTEIKDAAGEVVARDTQIGSGYDGNGFEQNMIILSPALWSPATLDFSAR